MRIWRSIGLAALALATLTPTAFAQDSTATVTVPDTVIVKKPSAPKSSIPERRAWMIGFNTGYGATRFVGADRTVTAELRSDTGVEYPPLVTGRPDWSNTDIESAPTVQFRLGYAINPNWAVSFERSAWSKDFQAYKWDFALSMLSATYYPGAGHFFVRGGAGITTLSEKVPSFFPRSSVGITTLAAGVVYDTPFFVQYDDHGFGIDLAAGYERRLLQRVSIVPEISLHSMTYSGGIRSQIAAASLGLNWWF
ncbi:MAG: hypothetical protein ABIS67_07705 [Candidatus Eisenbacteria bacterium]